MTYYTYILASKQKGTFYVGVTNDIARRVYEHKQGLVKGFTQKHNVRKLVYFELYDDVRDAIYREKMMKKWKRCFKIDAIERMNPEWKDLYFDL